MPNEEHGLAPSSYVETAEGPVQLSETPNKGFAVLTRFASGQLGFRQLIKVVTRGPVPLVRIVFSTGHEVLAAPFVDESAARDDPAGRGCRGCPRPVAAG